MNLALNIYHLTPDELEHWDFVYKRIPAFVEMIDDSAAVWRDRFRPIFDTEEECREVFLKTCCEGDKTPCTQDAEMCNIPSLARYMCLCTEQRVAFLDANEDSNENLT